MLLTISMSLDMFTKEVESLYVQQGKGSVLMLLWHRVIHPINLVPIPIHPSIQLANSKLTSGFLGGT